MAKRMPKVNELLRQELSRLIHEKLGGKIELLTITDVEVTNDLQLATVHVSVINDDAEKVRSLLQDYTRYFQQELARKLTMKFIPKLTFAINDEETHARVEKLLEELS